MGRPVLLSESDDQILTESGDQIVFEYDHIEWLNDPYTEKVYLVKASPYNPFNAQVEDQYFSDMGFLNAPTDTPANQWWDPRVISPIRISKTLTNEARLRGFAAPDVGDITIATGDDGDGNTLDDLILYYWDGRDIEVQVGGPDFDYSEFGPLFTGKTDGISYGEDRLTIIVRDPKNNLDNEIQDNLYKGTGGLEGESDIANVKKPIVLGDADQIEPVYLGAVDGLDTFQFHDTENWGRAFKVQSVTSNGVFLTEVSSNPSAGEYVVDLDKGIFQLGGSAGETLILAEIQGMVDGGDWKSKPGEIIESIVKKTTNLAFESGTVNKFDSDFEESDGDTELLYGYYIKEGGNTLSIISDILKSATGYMTYNKKGELVLGRLKSPYNTAADATFDKDDILAVDLSAQIPPVWKIQVGYQIRWRVMDTANLAGSLSDDTKQRFTTKYTYKEKADTEVKLERNNAKNETLNTEFDETLQGFVNNAMQNETNRLLNLFREDRRIYEVTVGTNGFDLTIGSTVCLSDDRLKVDAGENYRVIGVNIDAQRGRTKLRLWGGAPFVDVEVESSTDTIVTESGERLIYQ